MKYKHLLSVLTLVCLMISLFDPPPGKTKDIDRASPQALLSQPSGYFTENKGQWKDDILYMGRTPSGNVLLGETRMIFHDLENARLIQTSFVDSNAFQVMEKDPLPHYHNYLIGNDPAHWGIECRNFQQIHLNNVWEGIDVKYTFTEEGLKKEFHIHPKASIYQIQMEVNEVAWGSPSPPLDASEQSSFFSDANLSAYTKDSATSVDIRMQYHDSLLFFEGETVSSSEPVVIESLVYSTYMGGSQNDRIHSIALDDKGCLYAAGNTNSEDFPMSKTPGGEPAPGYDQIFKGIEGQFGMSYMAFIVKLNPEGTELEYATYLGGSHSDWLGSMVIDKEGYIYLAGYTNSPDFPMSRTLGGETIPGYDQIFKGIEGQSRMSYMAFIIKLNPEGTELVYATYLGGSKDDFIEAMVLDAHGYAYIAGYTRSDDFPMTKTIGGSPVPGHNQTFKDGRSGFVVKLNPEGTELEYATFLGGTVHTLTVDSRGYAYIAGLSDNPNFLMNRTVGGEPAPGYNQTHTGQADAFVVKLNPEGTELEYATFLGGSNTDAVYAIEVDSEGSAYVAGFTYSDDFPMSRTVGGDPAPGYDKEYRGTFDDICKESSNAFVVKLNPEGTELEYATYLGGSGTRFGDYAYDILLDQDRNLYITGGTTSIDFPMSRTVGGEPAPGYDHQHSGLESIFLLKLNAWGTELEYATFLGGSHLDWAGSIALDHQGNIYIGGSTRSDDFQMGIIPDGEPAPGYDHTFKGEISGFLIKLNTGTAMPVLQPPRLEMGSITLVEPGLYQMLLHNKGEAELTGKLATEADFLMIEPSEFLISSGSSLKIALRLLPEAIPKPGVLRAVIQIQSNDPEQLEITIDFIANYGIHIVLTIGKLQSIVNEKEVMLDVPPMIMEGRTLVPLRFIAEGFGASVEWLPEADQEIQIKLGDQRIRLWIGNRQALIETLTEQSEVQSTEEIALEVAPLIREGRTLVPLRFIAEGFGASVEWDGTLQQVTIYYWG